MALSVLFAENQPKATVSAFGNEYDFSCMGASESRRMDLTALPGRFSIQFEFAPGEVGWNAALSRPVSVIRWRCFGG